MTPAESALIAVNGGIAYAWAVFPALLSRISGKGPAARSEDALPPVTFILSAYNEEGHIAARIRNLRELDYPASRLRALIGVDGSKDRTAAEARAAAEGSSNLVVFDFPQNRGKVSVLKDLVSRARSEGDAGDILVFTDANTDFRRDALRKLVAPLADPAVGGVCGKLLFVRPKDGKTEENAYWKFENWLKLRESAVDSCLGANGAIYAIRAPLFWTGIPSNTIIDDFVIAMKVREQGYRVVYEPEAVATEELPSEVADEWKRRVRIGAGDFQALRLCRACLRPSFGLFAWMFWSHKVLRWFTPHLAIAGVLLAAVAAWAGSPLGYVVLAGYLVFAAAAIAGSRAGVRSGRAAKLFRAFHYLVAMHAALFAGFLRFCRGNLEGRWQRTAR